MVVRMCFHCTSVPSLANGCHTLYSHIVAGFQALHYFHTCAIGTSFYHLPLFVVCGCGLYIYIICARLFGQCLYGKRQGIFLDRTFTYTVA